MTLSVGVAFFFKQWGGRYPKDGGRELDGRTWDALPRRHVAQALWAADGPLAQEYRTCGIRPLWQADATGPAIRWRSKLRLLQSD
jgi:hypothetical protein